MCGLVGVAGNITKGYKTVFQQLLYVDALRGWDSTGVLMVDKKMGWHTVKGACCASDLMNLKSYEDLFVAEACVLLGHNRHATVGNVTNGNAHPFHTGNVIGAHNGTLLNKGELLDSDKFETDSQTLFNSISKVGLAETYAKIWGAWALSWWDEKDCSLNFIRNHERPLHICYTLDRRTLFWASEPKMLEWVLHRNKVMHTQITELKVHYHYKFTDIANDKSLDSLEVKEVKPRTPPDRHQGNIFPLQGQNVEFRVEYIANGKVHSTMYEYPYWDTITELQDVPSGMMIKAGQWISGKISRLDYQKKIFEIDSPSLKQQNYIIISESDGLEDDQICSGKSEVCAWCGSPIMPEENAVRVDSECAICESCQEFDEVQQYLM